MQKLKAALNPPQVCAASRAGLPGHGCRGCRARGRGSAGLKRAAGGLALVPQKPGQGGGGPGAGGGKRWRASGVDGKKLVDRLSTKAKVEGGKSVTSSAQPNCTHQRSTAWQCSICFVFWTLLGLRGISQRVKGSRVVAWQIIKNLIRKLLIS